MENVSCFSSVLLLASETSPQSFGASATIPSHPKELSVIEYFAGENLDLIRFCNCDLNIIFTSFYKVFQTPLVLLVENVAQCRSKTSNQESNWSARKRKTQGVPSVVYDG